MAYAFPINLLFYLAFGKTSLQFKIKTNYTCDNTKILFLFLTQQYTITVVLSCHYWDIVDTLADFYKDVKKNKLKVDSLFNTAVRLSDSLRLPLLVKDGSPHDCVLCNTLCTQLFYC